MFNNLIEKFIYKGVDLHKNISESAIITSKQSVMIISLHKCATAFISQRVLDKSQDLIPIKYQEYAYHSEKNISPILHNIGYLYGIIRVLEPVHPGYTLMLKLLNNRNLKNLKILFWIRDPRDILVSMYYSFGFSHGFSPIENIKKFQKIRRDKIQKLTLDEYVIQESYVLKEKLDLLDKIASEHKNKIVLKYEDMIEDFPTFYERFNSYFNFSEETEKMMYNETRPNNSENNNQHKRNGNIYQYKNKLKATTIKKLNNILSNFLFKYNYAN